MHLTINIKDKNLQKQISHYLSNTKQKENEFMVKLIKQFFQNESRPLLSKEEIAKTVENSQRIEGYEPVSKEYELEVEKFMKENGLEISA